MSHRNRVTVYVCVTCLVIKLSFFFSHISGITTVLTLSTIALDSRTDLPKVHYATALDWFIICCFGYCIATLLQFAGVHYFTKVFTLYIFAYKDIFSVYDEVMHAWSFLKFTGWILLVILGHFASFWVILGHPGSFWIILGHSGKFWVILGHSGSC